MATTASDEAAWERTWREFTDEQLIQSAKDHLWRELRSPQPAFGRFGQICREAHRRGKPEILLSAVALLVPVWTASGEDVRLLVGAIDSLEEALVVAGRKIVEISGEREDILLANLRERLRAARRVAERFR